MERETRAQSGKDEWWGLNEISFLVMGKKALPECRSLKLQKIYLSSVAWSAVRLTQRLTLTFQNQNEAWEGTRGGGGG